MFIDYEVRCLQQQEREVLSHFAFGAIIALIGFILFFLLFITQAEASRMKGHARYYPTPIGTTCADVRQKRAQYGFTSIAQARAYAAVHGILVTASQERQILACLRGSV